jgi:hypothetical protein
MPCQNVSATQQLVSPRFRQFTSGPYDPRRQLLMALLLNSFAGGEMGVSMLWMLF